MGTIESAGEAGKVVEGCSEGASKFFHQLMVDWRNSEWRERGKEGERRGKEVESAATPKKDN